MLDIFSDVLNAISASKSIFASAIVTEAPLMVPLHAEPPTLGIGFLPGSPVDSDGISYEF